jgi:hypothetical protein
VCVKPPHAPRLWLQPGDAGRSVPAGAAVSPEGTRRKPFADAAQSGELQTSVTFSAPFAAAVES